MTDAEREKELAREIAECKAAIIAYENALYQLGKARGEIYAILKNAIEIYAILKNVTEEIEELREAEKKLLNRAREKYSEF